jgi:hypothetical protein
VCLFIDATDYDPTVLIGDIAHINAASNQGPRANQALSQKQRNDYENLILLCSNCHARLDGQKNTNTVEVIRTLKKDHEEWVRKNLNERGQSTTGWSVVLLQGPHPFDLEPIITALQPDFPVGTPVIIKADPSRDAWSDIKTKLASIATMLLETDEVSELRMAVFPLAPVSACLGFGYFLTNRPRVKLFQSHRDDHSWTWFDEPFDLTDLSVDGIPNVSDTRTGDVAVRFHLSARITDEAVAALGHEYLGMIDVQVPYPDTGWLRSPGQLKALAKQSRKVFETLSDRYLNAERWHIFFAGPASGAVAVGQQLNPTMCPPVQLYEYRRDRAPAYVPGFVGGNER